jgi:hypothetical protein
LAAQNTLGINHIDDGNVFRQQEIAQLLARPSAKYDTIANTVQQGIHPKYAKE